jgi:PERQ amino acid-rich with GYF domain-containing protein
MQVGHFEVFHHSRAFLTGIPMKDSATPTLNRKQSLSALQSPGVNTRSNTGQPSPRVRQGFSGGGFDGVLGSEAWTSRRRISEASRPGAISRDSSSGLSGESGEKGDAVQDGRDDDQGRVNGTGQGVNSSTASDSAPGVQTNANGQANKSAGTANHSGNGLNLPEPTDLAAVEWSYKDPSGNIQGKRNELIMRHRLTPSSRSFPRRYYAEMVRRRLLCRRPSYEAFAV